MFVNYSFEKRVDRRGQHSAKWEEMGNNFSTSELLPMWIADMDLETAPEIIEALQEKTAHGIYGYVYRPDSYFKSAALWTKKRFGYDLDAKTLLHSPGVVPSLSLCVRLFTKEKDAILIQSPVYYPFYATIQNNHRRVVENKLLGDEAGYYRIDLEDFERKIVEEKVKLFLLCSPHNPVGRVWKEEELRAMAEICLKHGVRVLADEIWRDLIMPENKHIPFASLSEEVEDMTITCFSATKTFNLAGLQASFISFPRREEWLSFDKELGILDIKRNSPFNLVAFETAFTKGEAWLEALVKHLNSNMDYVIDFCKREIPELKIQKPEGTYLMWLDFSALGFQGKELSKFIEKEAKLALDHGYWFGKGAGEENFERINVACPRYLLEEGMKRLAEAVKHYRKEREEK